ncbi:MAG: tetratricopeptide repeat protein [Legionellales bacterium]
MSNQPLHDKLERHLSFLAQDSSNFTLLIEIYDFYLQLGDWESAQTYLNKAKVINPEACFNHQGLLYLHQRQYSPAKECFLEALKLADSPALRYNLGLSYFMGFEFEQAWDVLAPLLEGSHFPDAELLMARILHRQDAMDEAISLLENILEHNPDDADALGMLALMYFDMNEAELAIETALRSLELNPNNYDATLVSIMTRLLTQETSIEEIEALIKINPEDTRLWFALGNTYVTQGNTAAAEKALQKAVTIYPEFYDCHIVLAWCQLLNNRISKAINTYQLAANLEEELADAWGGLALIHALKEDYLESEQLINKAKALNQDCFLTELAETIYFNHKNPIQAKQHLIKALNNSKLPVSEKLVLVLKEMQSLEA